MAIEKRVGKDGKPAYRVRISDRDPATGKRRNITVGTFPTMREAKRKLREAESDQDDGIFVDPAKTTLRELLDAWLNTKRGTISENAHAEYRIAIEKHILPALGHAKVQKLTPATIQAQYDRWRDAYAAYRAAEIAWKACSPEERGPGPKRQGLSPIYMKRVHMVLSQALDYGVKLRMLAKNPAIDTTLPKPEKKEVDAWNASELRRFLPVAVHDSKSPLWRLLGVEGMRRGEALGLRWRDVDFERRTAHLVQTVVADQTKAGAAKIQPRTKTAAGARTVRLTPETLALLLEHRDRQRFLRQQVGSEWEDNDLIVTTSKGTPVNPSNVQRAFHRLCDEAGVKRITVHGLRHTAITLLMASNVPIKMISERVGHSSVQITLDRYSHLLPDMQDVAAQAMSRLLATDAESTGTA